MLQADRCPLFPIICYVTVLYFAIPGASGIIFLNGLENRQGLRLCRFYSLLYPHHLIQYTVHSRYLTHHLFNKRMQGIKKLEPLAKNSVVLNNLTQSRLMMAENKR